GGLRAADARRDRAGSRHRRARHRDARRARDRGALRSQQLLRIRRRQRGARLLEAMNAPLTSGSEMPEPSTEPIVVTGAGVVTPVARGRAAFLSELARLPADVASGVPRTRIEGFEV